MSQEKLLEYFMAKTDERFDRVETKIDLLLAFKWQIIAGATLMSGVLAIAIQLAAIFWGK